MITEFEGIIGGIAGAVLMILSAFVTHKFDEAAYADLKATTAKAYESAEKAYSEALTAQQSAREATEKRNDQISASLVQVQNDAANAHRDADFAQRLLVAARTPSTPATTAAQSAGRRGVDDPAKTSGDRSAFDLSQTLADSASECRDAIERFTALQLQLRPQL